MDLLIFQRDKYFLLYNCTNFDANLVPIGRRIHTVHGIILIILFFVFELLYIPCMLSMYHNLSNACYKLLFYIGITDMLVMLMNGFETGLLSISGAVFCTYPDLIYTIHDLFVIFGLSAIYITFSVLLIIQTQSYNAHYQATLAQKLTFLQVVLISFFNGMAAGIYIYMQSVRISDALIIAGTYAWLLAHGIPPLIYLALNKTIRTDFVRYAKLVFSKCTNRCHPQQVQTPNILPMSSMRGVQLRGQNNANFVGTKNANSDTRGNSNRIRPISHAF
ncbi:hypothetical protein niasHS_004716 [Heterodera schachtii]|uniref:G protein-coupled receptor n=1 Tax=Heterodera schachtii TaxID=97005 RepID=A0ABD2JTC2_HETSC